MSKSLVCSCEDVTVDDVLHAVQKGFGDIESIKRYTGFGTGMCQGKSCQVAVARLLASRAHFPPERLSPFTPRRWSPRRCGCGPATTSTRRPFRVRVCLPSSPFPAPRCGPRARSPSAPTW
jgi:bacterioferritin-associated ferredoxin